MPFMTNIFNEYKREGDEKLSIKQHLENIRPYLHDMIFDLRTSGKWKINLFMLSKHDDDESQPMHSKSNQGEISLIDIDTDNSFLCRYQKGQKQQIKDSNFVFDHVDRLFYKYNEIGFKYSGSYIDSKKNKIKNQKSNNISKKR